MSYKVASLSLMTLYAVGTVSAQSPLQLPKIDGSIQLDGHLDEAAWSRIEPLPLVMYQPVYGGEMTERSEIRVGYDAHYVYVSGALYDSVPRGIRGNSLYRDQYSGDDTFAILLDPFNDDENVLWFFTTPNGIRIDMAVSDDASSGFESVNRSWNTYWDVATRQDDTGWFAEMRIPFSSLGFQHTGGSVEMGMTTYRYIARTNERHIFPAIRPDWDMGFAKASQARGVLLEGIETSNPVYATPYLLGGAGQRSVLAANGAGYNTDESFPREVGLDVKYNVTSNLTLDVTANTDFAQVEADNQEVNLTRFSLFFPEKRQFFQERSGIFNFDLGGPNRVFNSRRIGLDDEGQEVRILGGARLTGRVGEWDVGLIDMQTDKSANLPSENFGVVRIRRRILNRNSYAGAIATSRIGDDGTYNVTYGIDGSVRVTGDEYLEIKIVQSVDRDVVDATGYRPFDSGFFRATWERRTARGFAYDVVMSRVGENYRPASGFQTRTGYFRPRTTVSYGWFSDGSSGFRQIATSLTGFGFFRLDDRSVETAGLVQSTSLEFMSGVTLEADVEVETDDLTEPLTFASGASVPPGRYTFAAAEVRYSARDGALFRPNLSVRAGSFYDGTIVSGGFSPTWNISKHLEVGGELQGGAIRFGDRDDQFDFIISRIRTQVAIDTRASISAFVQYNSAVDIVSANIRMRYNFREGRDLWVVYNQGINSDRDRAIPRLPLTDNRAVLLKYTHTFDL